MFRARPSVLATISMVAHVCASRAVHAASRQFAYDFLAASKRFSRFLVDPAATPAARVAAVVEEQHFGRLRDSLPASEQRMLAARGVKKFAPDTTLVVRGPTDGEPQEYLMCRDAGRVYGAWLANHAGTQQSLRFNDGRSPPNTTTAGVSAFPALLHGQKPYELRRFDGAAFSPEEQTNIALSWALGCYKCVLAACRRPSPNSSRRSCACASGSIGTRPMPRGQLPRSLSLRSSAGRQSVTGGLSRPRRERRTWRGT